MTALALSTEALAESSDPCFKLRSGRMAPPDVIDVTSRPVRAAERTPTLRRKKSFPKVNSSRYIINKIRREASVSCLSMEYRILTGLSKIPFPIHELVFPLVRVRVLISSIRRILSFVFRVLKLSWCEPELTWKSDEFARRLRFTLPRELENVVGALS